MTITIDATQQRVLDIMLKTQENLFLTGKAGTGKSTLLKTFLQMKNKNVAVLAPTGVAALNVGGQTIHSFFKFPITVTVERARPQAEILEKLQNLDMIVIDEISMVRSDLLDCIHTCLSFARGSTEPFGGVQMVFIGDLYQLPPIVSRETREYFTVVHKYNSEFFFDADIMKNPAFMCQYIELEHIYRQDDKKFIDILNNVRNNTVTSADLEVLNKNVSEDVSIGGGYIYITTVNSIVNTVNQNELDSLDGDPYVFHAIVGGAFPENSFPADQRLELKVGAQIMFIKNDKDRRFVNGTMGKVTGISGDEETISIRTFDGEYIDIIKEEWTVEEYRYNRKDQRLIGESVGTFTQFPLRLGWACTIHKSQGKTFDKAIIDTGRGTFAPGHLYVALSRCKTLDGIKLKRPIGQQDVIVDSRVVAFMDKVHKANSIE